jgi:septum formation protein|tara:strand:- start:3835 stop:4416 length:582 start_codon:yes stop_codon:yes gene_type:complete
MKKKRIILGSSSKFRESLLNTLNLDFTCMSPDINESQLPNEKPKDMALRLSINKAKKICNSEKNAYVIGSDACAACEDKILGKPMKKNIAIEYLNFISGKTIIFYTGVCVMDSDTFDYKTDISKYVIKVKKLNDKQILDYIEKYKPYFSSAAFRYEVAKDLLIEEFIDKENDITGLIGLPLKKLQKILENLNI